MSTKIMNNNIFKLFFFMRELFYWASFSGSLWRSCEENASNMQSWSSPLLRKNKKLVKWLANWRTTNKQKLWNTPKTDLNFTGKNFVNIVYCVYFSAEGPGSVPFVEVLTVQAIFWTLSRDCFIQVSGLWDSEVLPM